MELQVYKLEIFDEWSVPYWVSVESLTGRWRCIDGMISIEVVHQEIRGFFKKRKVKERVWYDEDETRFVYTNSCP